MKSPLTIERLALKGQTNTAYSNLTEQPVATPTHGAITDRRDRLEALGIRTVQKFERKDVARGSGSGSGKE